MTRWLGCIILVLLMACSGKNDLPTGVLDRNKMEEVMWDMIQADQYFREYLTRDTVGKDVNQERYNLYEDVFKMHRISKATFDKSFEYYSNRPKAMKDIFDSLSVKGNRRLQDFYKPKTPAIDSANLPKLKPSIDSIRAK